MRCDISEKGKKAVKDIGKQQQYGRDTQLVEKEQLPPCGGGGDRIVVENAARERDGTERVCVAAASSLEDGLSRHARQH